MYIDPSGHFSFSSFIKSVVTGIVGGAVFVASGGTAAPVLAGIYAGMAAGATSAAINGGDLGDIVGGALMGGAMGAIGGAFAGYVPYGGEMLLAGGAGMAYEQGGIDGLAYFGGGFLGSYIGYTAGLEVLNSMNPKGSATTGTSDSMNASFDPSKPRPLTDCEKNTLSPYIKQVDLNNAILHDGDVPWYLRSEYDGITRGNHIYFRKGVYNSKLAEGLALLGHELVHVGQYREGMTVLDYAWSTRNGYMNSVYEKQAYALQAKIQRDLIKSKFGGCKCP